MKAKGNDYADVEQLIQAGLDHYLQGRLREAASSFHEALWLDPANEQARVYLKTTLSTSGMPAPGPSPDNATLPPETAWDDGASVQEDLIVEDDASMPAPMLQHITQPPTQPPAPPMADVRVQTEALIAEARAFEARGDFTGAFERCERLLGIQPTHIEALTLLRKCTDTLIQMYESRLGTRDGIPEVVTRPAEMIWLNLDHRAGFVLAQIDGMLTYDDLYAVCGMSQLDTSRVLSELLSQNIIRTKARNAGRARGK